MLEVSGLRVASGAMIRVDGLDLSLPERGCIALLGTEWGRKDRQRRSDQPVCCARPPDG